MKRETESTIFVSYEKFANLVRTWFITYGIGAIVFLASQKTISDALKGSSDAKHIINYLLCGLALQVTGALLYKYTMGILYHGEIDKQLCKTRRYRFSVWVSESFLLEGTIDLATVCAYIYATYLISNIVINN